MRIILDTSAIIESSSTLQSPDFLTLFSARHHLHLELVVPRLVIDELINKYREKLVARVDELKKVISSVNALVQEPLHFAIAPNLVDLEIAAYERRIKTQLVEANTRISPYPNDSHEDVALRALSRRKPFAANGAGYRDSLIWLSILDELGRGKQDQETVFVSCNDKDFFHPVEKNRWTLHHDLLQDLDFMGFPRDRFLAFRTLRELRDDVINPRLETKADLEQRVLRKEFLHHQFAVGIKRAVEAWFEKYLNAKRFLWLGLPPETYSVSEASVGEIERYEAAQVREVSRDELVVDLTVAIRVRFEVATHARDSDDQPLFSFDLGIPRVSHTSLNRTLRFIVSGVFGPGPKHEVLAMDASHLIEEPAAPPNNLKR